MNLAHKARVVSKKGYMKFSEFITELLAENLSVEFLLDRIKYGLLRDYVEECFLKEGYSLPVKEKTKAILTTLFSALVRNSTFSEFLTKIPEAHENTFLTTLLYHIYYLHINVEHLVSAKNFEFYLLRTLALSASVKVLQSIYNEYSFATRLSYSGFFTSF